MLRDELEAVLPTTDPLTGDQFQFITRDEYISIMGPIHESRFMHMASFHPDGDTSKPVVYNLEHFLDLFWTGDIAGIIRWDDGVFRNVTVYRRINPIAVRTVMHVGETSTGNTVRIALYDIGIRIIEQEVPLERIGILNTMGAEVIEINSRGRYEMRTHLNRRPIPGHYAHPANTNLGRR